MRNDELINAIAVSAEPVRMKILRDLAAGGEMKAKDLLGGFDITQPTLSHHMALLEENGLVICRREGRCVYYAVNVKTFEAISEFYSGFTKPAAAPKAAPKVSVKETPKAAPKTAKVTKVEEEKPKKKKDKEKDKKKKDKKKKSK